MIPIDGVIENLQREEGFRQYPYRCTANKLTIGYGRCIQEGAGLGISRDEAEMLLRNDVDRTVAEVIATYPWIKDLADDAQAVLIELGFQLGGPRLAGFARMIEGLRRKDYDWAANELIDSRFAIQCPARADRLANRLRRC